MFQPMPARWLALSLGLVTLTASAQIPAASVVQAQPASGEYRSALEGYVPYSEIKMVPWREANDTVGKIGGWKAYAKEAAQEPGHEGHAGHPSPAASAPKPSATPKKP